MMNLKTIWYMIPQNIKNKIYMGVSLLILVLLLIFLWGYSLGMSAGITKCIENQAIPIILQ